MGRKTHRRSTGGTIWRPRTACGRNVLHINITTATPTCATCANDRRNTNR